MHITEGSLEFLGYSTYYRITGSCRCGKKPLLLLHGGPGSTHNYFEVLDPLAEEDGRALIMYDQLGCGRSQAPGRTDLFNMQTWLAELIQLRTALGLENCHILGHSWGGMLLLEYLCAEHPQGISSIILSSTLPSTSLWGSEQRRLLLNLPHEMQDAVAEADRTGEYTSEAYRAANAEFMHRYCGPDITASSPDCLTRKKHAGSEAYLTAWGQNEYTPTGNLKYFDRTADLVSIHVPALVCSGASDMCTPLIADTLQNGIPGAERVLFEHSRHTAYVEETGRYIEVLKDWLNRHD